MATETIPHRDRRNPFFDTIKDRPRDRRNPFLDTIKDRPPRHSAETKITPPVKLEEVISGVWAVVKEDKRLTNEKLKKLSVANDRTRDIESEQQRQIKILQETIEGHQHSITVLLEHDKERLRRAGEKQTERSAKKEGSAWNRMKKLVSKDELENKYIVD